MANLESIFLGPNHLSGAIPEAMASLVLLSEMCIYMNRFSGSIAEAIVGKAQLKKLRAGFNRLSGSLPDGLTLSRSVTIFQVQENALSGKLPLSLSLVSSMVSLSVSENMLSGPIVNLGFLKEAMLKKNRLSSTIPNTPVNIPNKVLQKLYVDSNRLSGALPAAIACLKGLRELAVPDNNLSGAIPEALSLLRDAWALKFDASRNKLSGPLLTTPWFDFVDLNENQLTGSLPLLGCYKTEGLLCAKNMFEGTISAAMAAMQRLAFLDISGQACHTEHLRGPLPSRLGSASRLGYLKLSHQSFEGAIPVLSSTVWLFALNNNRFNLFLDVHLEDEGSAMVFLHNNQLSCELPRCGGVRSNQSLSALGNQLQKPAKQYPPWVSPMEHNVLFWTSDTEGSLLLGKVLGASCLLGGAIAIRLRGGSKASATLQWHTRAGGGRRELVQTCAHSLSFSARESLLQVFFLMLVLASWNLYKCPRTLAVASGCLREGTFMHVLVPLLWGHACLRLPAVESLGVSGEMLPLPARGTASQMSFVSSLAWSSAFLLTLVLSSLPSLHQACKSIPDLLPSGPWLWAITACTGAIQGAVGSLVVPRLAEKVKVNKHAFATIMSVIMSCVLPLAMTIYLDTQCLGHWAAMWKPCRTNARQFLRDFKVSTVMVIRALRERDICDPHYSLGMTSPSRCIDVALLRLQDIWLGKFITMGFFIPAGRLSTGFDYSDSGEVVGHFAAMLGFAVMTAGSLPLAMPLLMIAMLTEALLAAVACDGGRMQPQSQHHVGAVGVTLAWVVSGFMHAGLASNNLLALVLVTFIVLSCMVRGLVRPDAGRDP